MARAGDSGTVCVWLTAPELAEKLGVHRSTVHKWIQDGELKPDHFTAGNHARFSLSTLARLLARQYRSGAA